MKTEIYFLAILIMLAGCSSDIDKTADKQTNAFFVKHSCDLDGSLLLDTINIDFSKKSEDSIFILKYIYHYDTELDTLIYKLKESDAFKPELLYNSENVEFVYVAKRNYRIDNVNFIVYKYAGDPSAIDGCVTHFWTLGIGILLTRSTTWRNYKKFHTSNDKINYYIDLLTEMIYQDAEFYFGCDEQIEMMSESEVKDFFDWKHNEYKRYSYN